MKKALCIIGIIALICGISYAASWAQEQKADTKKEAAAPLDDKAKAEYTKKVGVFYQVVSYGETQKDPIVLLTAVKLLDDLPFGGVAKPGQDEKSKAYYDRTALLNQAKQYAAGDEELLAVIAKVQTPPEQVAVRGHGPYHNDYYGRHHHRRHYECVWFQVCRHGYCDWVCR